VISAELKLTIDTVGQPEAFDSVLGDVAPPSRVYCRNPFCSSHASRYPTDSIRHVLSTLPVPDLSFNATECIFADLGNLNS